jgi:Ras GTPase-activating-like protein IQGAP2/3
MRAKLQHDEVEAQSPTNASSANYLRGHDKETRHKLEQYQHLFYLLQTHPEYLAKMMWIMNNRNNGNVSKLLEGYVMAVYGYAQNAREEYLLLQLISVPLNTFIDQ